MTQIIIKYAKPKKSLNCAIKTLFQDDENFATQNTLQVGVVMPKTPLSSGLIDEININNQMLLTVSLKI